MKVFKIFFSVAVAMSLAACGTVQQTTSSSMVGVDRKQSFSVSSQAMDAQGTQTYAQILAQAEYYHALNVDPKMTARVRSIAKRLIGQAPQLRADSKDWEWYVNVFNSNEINAFCFSGGKIGVYSGLISRLGLTDDEIAQVMGHEIAHALREHSREQVSRERTTAIVTGLLSAVGQAYGVSARDANGLSSSLGDLIGNLPFSRKQESEADQIGIELAARAGYNPDAARTLWAKMAQANDGGRPLSIFSTHPSPENRQSNLMVWADTVRPLYQIAKIEPAPKNTKKK